MVTRMAALRGVVLTDSTQSGKSEAASLYTESGHRRQRVQVGSSTFALERPLPLMRPGRCWTR